jgi:hypothetical protein
LAGESFWNENEYMNKKVFQSPAPFGVWSWKMQERESTWKLIQYYLRFSMGELYLFLALFFTAEINSDLLYDI